MGTEFTFYDYVDAKGDNAIKAWLDGLDKAVKAKFNNWLRHLEAMPHGHWKRPHVDTLTGKCGGLFEIRVTKSRIQYRILGFHGPGQDTPTLAVGMRKLGRRIPSGDCEEALKIKELVEAQPTKRRMKHDFS